MHWHSLASSSCVGPLSQTQHGPSAEVDGFFIWKMVILWGHYACKLQPLCRELCGLQLKLQWTCHHPLVCMCISWSPIISHSHRQNCHELAKPLACQEAVNCALSSSSGYLLARKIKASETSKTPIVEVTKKTFDCDTLHVHCQFWNSPWKGWLLGQVSFKVGLFSLRVCKKSVSVQTALERWRLELERERMFSRRPQRDTDSEHKNTAKVHQVNHVSWHKFLFGIKCD